MKKPSVTPATVLEPLPRHEVIDLALRQAVSRIGSEWFRFIDLAIELIEGGLYTKFGYGRPEEYFSDRLGLAYRTVRRWIAVAEGVRRLPPPDQEPAQQGLCEIGQHKAGVLAPVLGRDGQDWRDWLEKAAVWGEARLQEAVSEACGLRPRGKPPLGPGEAWYRAVLAGLPDELAEETQRAFRLAEQALQSHPAHPMACWAAIIREFIGTWETHAAP